MNQQDTGPGQPPTNGAPTPHGAAGEREVSVLDLLLVLARNRFFILGTTVVFGCLAGLYGATLSESYTSEATVIREGESSSEQLGGGATALRGLGIQLGGNSGSGLGPGSYPLILETREVCLSVARDTFSFPDVDERMTYIEYANRPTETSWFEIFLDYTVWLPWTVWDALKTKDPVVTHEGSIYPTKEEEKAINTVEGKVETTNEGGFMVISTNTEDPRLSAELNKSFIRHLTDRVQDLRTRRTERNLEFVQRKYREAKKELEAAEDRLASFIDRNQNIQSAQLQNQQDRLRRQVQHQLDLYNDWQSQLTQAQIELQRSEPVVTTVEEPVPPSDPSGRGSDFFLIIGLFFGFFVGLAGSFVRGFLRYATEQSDEEVEAKIQELKQSFVPERLRRGLSRLQHD